MRGQDNEYAYIGAAATTQVVTGSGTLHFIVIGTTDASAIQIIDNTTGTTTNLAELKASIACGTYEFNIRFHTGLRIHSAGNSKFTVVYST